MTSSSLTPGPDHARKGWSDYTEPALIRSVALAVVQLAAALGIILPFDLPGIAEAIIGVLAAVGPILAGLAIRAKVRPAAASVSLTRAA